MKKYRLLVLFAALFAAGSYSFQSFAAKGWVLPHTNYYLTDDQQKLELALPPADGSAPDVADMDTVREWEQKRTADQCAKANLQGHATYESMFGDISPFPNPLPKKAAEALQRIKKETDSATGTLKERFQRPRPFRRDKKLNPCLGRINGYAYPSGHATIARMYALVLSELVPARRAEFMARGEEDALYRVIGGVHHPSDLEAGKQDAEELFARYKKSPAFLKDLEILRGCLKK